MKHFYKIIKKTLNRFGLLSNMVTNSSDNYFHILMENHVSKFIFNIFALLVIITFAPLYYFVVWYERYGGNDSKRTLISQLLALMCKIVIAYLLVGLTGEVLISTFGPLPSWCQIQTFFKYVIFTSLVVTFHQGRSKVNLR